MINEYPNWSKATWDRINQAVHDECCRTKVARKFLPFVMTDATAKTFPSDTVIVNEGEYTLPVDTLTVDEAATVTIHELVVEFSLTEQQVGEDAEMTAVTLATRAANLISQAEDAIIFEGEGALERPLFKDGRVKLKTKTNHKPLCNPLDGLLDAPRLSANNNQIIQVPSK